MLKRIVTLISLGLISGVYADQGKLDQIQKSLDNIMAKAGISIGGEFRSQYLGSKIGGDSLDPSKRSSETNEFTSVDFDIKARPNEAISGRIIFRMHQNWQNFFSDISNPIYSRWISIDGNPMGMFRFSIGDFKEKYSPLTLWSPDIELLYEPYVFARQREVAMDELFIGDNYRVLQGFNLGFDAEIVPIFNEFHFGLIGARLRSTETNIQNGSKVVDWFENAKTASKYPMSRYLVGSNLDMTFLKGVNFGATYLFTFDHRGSYLGSDTLARSNQEKVSIISARPGVDIGKIAGFDGIGLGVKTEFAFSIDDSTLFDSVGVDANNATVKDFTDTITSGLAINLGVNFDMKTSDVFGIVFGASYMMNSKDFRNALAQTPSFIGHRIMNVENTQIDTAGGVKDTVVHYSTFDALYHSVFKFTPQKASNNWVKAPFMKTSYYRGIMDKSALNTFASEGFDPSVQLVLPFGPATPNRAGISTNLAVSLLNNGIELSGLLLALKEAEGESVENGGVEVEGEKTAFMQVGGGLKVDFSKFIEVFKYPLELSGSIVSSSAKNKQVGNDYTITSNFKNLGLYWQFWKRGALIGGLQLISNEAEFLGIASKQNLAHWTGGVEWKVSDGAAIVTTVGQILADNDELASWGTGTSSDGHDYNQLLLDIFLRVKF
ncbi:MAG: hypothetical protein GX556_03440 [Fibrobacter sp.]|nr:hypothetical protein [Fibrobacter sp.]